MVTGVSRGGGVESFEAANHSRYEAEGRCTAQSWNQSRSRNRECTGNALRNHFPVSFRPLTDHDTQSGCIGAVFGACSKGKPALPRCWLTLSSTCECDCMVWAEWGWKARAKAKARLQEMEIRLIGRWRA